LQPKRAGLTKRKMKTRLLHITSGKGPAECELAVAHLLREIMSEAKRKNIFCEVMSRTKGTMNGTLSSAVIEIKGAENDFIESWLGSLLWIAKSPYRKFHKRKNWFAGIHEVKNENWEALSEKDVLFQTMRASGPGGQQVNKTESAVRAIHKPTGLFSVCNLHRSQLQNKRQALERLKEKYAVYHREKIANAALHTEQFNNNNLERGNPTRIYEGEKFLRR
jgi:peptide chain release factor